MSFTAHLNAITDPEKRRKMGFDMTKSVADQVTDFLSRTNCFENQLMSQIESDLRAKNKAKKEILDSCVGVAQDEYQGVDENILKRYLEKESNSTIRSFLQNHKYRKKLISRAHSRDLNEQDFSDIDFENISKIITGLDPTRTDTKKIQQAWLAIAGIAKPGESLSEAFHNLVHNGETTNLLISSSYETFFRNSNTFIPERTRTRLLDALLRAYLPTIPIDVLEAVDPKESEKMLMTDADKTELTKNIPSDP